MKVFFVVALSILIFGCSEDKKNSIVDTISHINILLEKHGVVSWDNGYDQHSVYFTQENKNSCQFNLITKTTQAGNKDTLNALFNAQTLHPDVTVKESQVPMLALNCKHELKCFTLTGNNNYHSKTSYSSFYLSNNSLTSVLKIEEKIEKLIQLCGNIP